VADLERVVLSLATARQSAKRRVVVRRAAAMSRCRSAKFEGLAYQPGDIATTRRTITRRCLP
jgi:hypothetical protein